MKLFEISTFCTLMEFSRFLEQIFEVLRLSSGSSETFLWVRRHNTMLSFLTSFFVSGGVPFGSLGLFVFFVFPPISGICSVGHFDIAHSRTSSISWTNFLTTFCNASCWTLHWKKFAKKTFRSAQIRKDRKLELFARTFDLRKKPAQNSDLTRIQQ